MWVLLVLLGCSGPEPSPPIFDTAPPFDTGDVPAPLNLDLRFAQRLDGDDAAWCLGRGSLAGSWFKTWCPDWGQLAHLGGSFEQDPNDDEEDLFGLTVVGVPDDAHYASAAEDGVTAVEEVYSVNFTAGEMRRVAWLAAEGGLRTERVSQLFAFDDESLLAITHVEEGGQSRDELRRFDEGEEPSDDWVPSHADKRILGRGSDGDAVILLGNDGDFSQIHAVTANGAITPWIDREVVLSDVSLGSDGETTVFAWKDDESSGIGRIVDGKATWKDLDADEGFLGASPTHGVLFVQGGFVREWTTSGAIADVERLVGWTPRGGVVLPGDGDGVAAWIERGDGETPAERVVVAGAEAFEPCDRLWPVVDAVLPTTTNSSVLVQARAEAGGVGTVWLCQAGLSATLLSTDDEYDIRLLGVDTTL